MPVLPRLQFLSCMVTIITVYFQETESDQPISDLGQSMCSYIGMYASLCEEEAIALNALPSSCTTFIYESVFINAQHKVHPFTMDPKNEFLDILSHFGKPLFVNIGHDGFLEWTAILDCDGKNALKDATGIKNFFSKYQGITGLLLRSLEPEPDSDEFADFTQHVCKYIDIVKRETGMKIALTFRATFFYENYYKNPGVTQLNFTQLDPYVEFYTFTLFGFDDGCTDKTRDGRTPLDGDAEYTFEKLGLALQKSGMPKNKIFLMIPLMPVTPDGDGYFCSANYGLMCLDCNATKTWCADTQETFFKKGQWARQNGGGFVGSYVDIDDPQNVCKCGAYPSFNAVLAGYNGAASVPPCRLFDGHA